ncbi:MAG: HIT domain-containing protein [Nevskia sp.]|nr:HIT domain-containing protein [Nevskia sp.]
MSFVLPAPLAADGIRVGATPLCELLLMNDAQYPWFVLVPRRAGVREIYQLEDADQLQLLRESVRLSRALMQAYGGDKLNVAALGNLVPQLHVHHVVRYRGDPAWPAPVWGRHPMRPYTVPERAARLAALAKLLPDWLGAPDVP